MAYCILVSFIGDTNFITDLFIGEKITISHIQYLLVNGVTNMIIC